MVYFIAIIVGVVALYTRWSKNRLVPGIPGQTLRTSFHPKKSATIPSRRHKNPDNFLKESHNDGQVKQEGDSDDDQDNTCNK